MLIDLGALVALVQKTCRPILRVLAARFADVLPGGHGGDSRRIARIGRTTLADHHERRAVGGMRLVRCAWTVNILAHPSRSLAWVYPGEICARDIFRVLLGYFLDFRDAG